MRSNRTHNASMHGLDGTNPVRPRKGLHDDRTDFVWEETAERWKIKQEEMFSRRGKEQNEEEIPTSLTKLKHFQFAVKF